MNTQRAQYGFQFGIFALVAGSGVSFGQVAAADLAGAAERVDPVVSTTGGAALPEVIAGPFQFGGSAYYLLEPATWEMSEQAAVQRLGAHLVTVNDAGENAFIRNSVLNFDGENRNGWIGLTDRDTEGTFVWADNQPVGYTNWIPGEPDGGVSENYAGMVQGSSRWADLQNNWGDVFVPMYGVVEVDIPSIEAGPFYYNGHTYYLMDHSNRIQADAAARAFGGHLVTIDDEEERDWVYSNVVRYDGGSRRAWIGLSDAKFEGIYDWDNDSLSLYRSWLFNEPSASASENYVVMTTGGSWFDAAYNWGPNGAVVYSVVEIASPNPCTVDMNNDGELDFFDISEFLSRYGAGCP